MLPSESRFLFTFAVLFCLTGPTPAQVSREHERDMSETERPASESRTFLGLFTKLERDWMEAARRKDNAALDAILAPEFTMLSSEKPERPMPRAEWMQRSVTGFEVDSYSNHAMLIRAFLRVAVVSFVQSRKATCGGRDCSGDYMIVDLWEANHNRWQVFARYMAPVGVGFSDFAKAEK